MILKGQRIILRPIRMADAPNFVRWFKDKEVTRFTSTENVSLAKEKKVIKSFQKEKNKLRLAIDLLADRRPIGGCSIEYLAPKVYGLGIIIGEKSCWNKGYGTEVIKLLLQYGFVKKKAERIELDVFEKNKRAQKVYRRCGLKVEGLRRNKVFKRGKMENDYIMAILKKEWVKKK